MSSPQLLAEAWHAKKGFVWLDSLRAEASDQPMTEGLSILAAEPYRVIEGKAHEWHLLKDELAKKKEIQHSPSSGAAIGFFRYDGSFCFGFYENTVRYQEPSTKDFSPKVESTVSSLSPPAFIKPLCFTPDLSEKKYCSLVKQAQEQIAAGNIYQVCLAHRFTAPCKENPWPLYLALRKKSPAPFAAYLHLGHETILSSSPECFLKMKGRHILTRPIKGTRPRQSTPEADRQQSLELQQSSKEKAELVMITDLERNDLGKICCYGTVIASQLLHLERFPQVFHLTSTVEGTLRSEVCHVDAVAACFPGGSISGAPKKMAMKIINELEPVSRGLFSGAIGYFGFNGESQFNIAIRTMVISDTQASFHVGAGITSDSIPKQEWEETLHKASGLLSIASV